MDSKMKAILIMTPLLLNACATATKSTLLGVALGGTIGGVIAQNHTQSQQGTTTGAALGAGLGGLIGYMAYRDKEGKNKKSEPTLNDNEFPPLTRPKLRSMWVPDKIEGNKYIKGHFIYIIDDPGNWSKE